MTGEPCCPECGTVLEMRKCWPINTRNPEAQVWRYACPVCEPEEDRDE